MKSKLFFTFFICASGLTAQTGPSADFSVSKINGCSPLTVVFTNNSLNASSYLWNFGNGDTSTLENPSHIYFNNGTFTPFLIAYSSNGQSDTFELQSPVEVSARPLADFSIANNISCANGLPVIFSNLSANATNFIWDFGDGLTSTQTSPSHVYSSAGTYNVALIAQNSLGCQDVKLLSQYIVISSKPSADFWADTTKYCSLNHSFVFTPAGTSVLSYNWNFHDGSFSSLQSPAHIFSSEGKKTITLTVSGLNGCSNSLTKSNYITLSKELTPAFSVSNNTGCTPLNVNFNSNLPASLIFSWNFGDGNTSGGANPSHLYNNNGIFDVSFTVTDANACSYPFTYDGLVNTNDPLQADFSVNSFNGCSPMDVDFSDLSVNASSWEWNFGDGTVSTLKNPSHVYTNPGIYSVSLKVKNQDNCESIVQKQNLLNISGTIASFSVNETSGCSPLAVSFTDSSLNANQWHWDFGDGATSSLKNPAHVYTADGFYTVKLIVTGNNGCTDTIIKNNFIHSFDSNISFSFPDTIKSCNQITASFNGSSLGANLWTWDFGDGTTSSEANPVHTYSAPGIYPVTLTTQSANGCPTILNNYNVFEIFSAEADFSFSVDSCPDFMATFYNNSPGAVSWFWSFGDGTFSTDQNPVHTYSNAGIFSVGLNLFTSTGCTFSVMKNNCIVFLPCDSSAGDGGGMGGGGSSGNSGNPDSTNNTFQIAGCSPFKAYFSNPFDSVSSVLWLFGDGDSSALENPSHIYADAGIYDVTLVVHYYDFTSDTIIRNDFIKVNKVEAGFSIQQTNNCDNSSIILNDSSVNADFYLWKFGDGDSSMAQYTSHIYDDAGNYLVKLLSYDSMGCNNTAIKNIFAGVVIPVFNINEIACINDTVSFTSNMNNFYTYEWNFGDGNFSSEESPVHVFDSAGSFMISLTVYDSFACSISSVFQTGITVSDPVADFTVTNNSGCNTLLAAFNDLSMDAESWSWDFGDGTTSTLQNPSHIYSIPGSYPVSLTVQKNGCTNQLLVPAAVNVYASSADFSFTQNSVCFPVTASFSDGSGGAISWWWNFGDGITDTTQNPVHIFNIPPTGNISLTIIDSNGCASTLSKPNIDQFLPEISASAFQGCDSLHVVFSDLSDSAVSWEWNFGDGSVSNIQNPTHFYSDSGLYTVTLIAESKEGCTDTAVFLNYIQVYSVIADFNSPSVLSGCNPLLINYMDNSLNATHWNWNFGDGTFSSQKNPWHIYTLPSLNDISLIASNDFGCSDTMIKNNYVNVTGPVASFNVSSTLGCAPFQVQFFDSSENNAINLTWYFGDDDTSHAENPFHIYDSTGSYMVSLLAEDTSGCSSYYSFPQNILVNPVPEISISDFTTSGCRPLEIFFDPKLVDTDSAYWNFGDGSSSHFTSGSHLYDSAGEFGAILIASNNYGCTDSFFYPPIKIFATPVADFSALNSKGCSPLSVTFVNTSEELSNPVYEWNFGNGQLSSEENPASVYGAGGLFDVSLIVTNEGGCSDTVSKSNLVMAYDNIPPANPEVVVVTVASNSSVLIVWKESIAADFEKFILYRKNNYNGHFIEVAVFNDMDVTSFTDENLNTLENSYCYKLQAVDFCGNSKDLLEIVEYCTINVKAKPDSSKILVSWSPYSGCNISNYEILRKKSGQPEFESLAVVEPDVLSYVDTSWYCFTQYSYKIMAVNVCGNPINSFSDTSMAKADENVFANQKVEIIRSTVIGNSVNGEQDSSVFTEWKSPEFAPEKVSGYKIFRSPGNQKFELIGLLPATVNSYVDKNVDVSKQNYYYKIETINICQVKTVLSNNSSSVLLGAEREEYEVKLKWTPYKNWENGVEQYIIERQDENGNWHIVKIVDGSVNEWNDSILK